MVIGKVRAWLKYLLDKLFDQEGSNPSNSRRKVASRESPSETFAAAPGNGDEGISLGRVSTSFQRLQVHTG